MASYGLLGALAGAGQALQTIGQDMQRRRDQALQWAREEMREQQRRTERVADRNFQADLQREITGAQIDARAEGQRFAAKTNLERDEQRQQGRIALADREAAARERLARLNHQLQSSQSERDIRLRAELARQNAVGVEYGTPNQQGQAEIIIVRRDGTTQNTGRYVAAPRTRRDPQNLVGPDPLDDE